MSRIKRIQYDVSGKGYKSQQDRFYLGGGDMCAIPSSRTENKLNILIPEATKQGFAVAGEGDSINLSQPNSKTRRGRVGVGVANTLDTQMEQYTIVRRVENGKLDDRTLEGKKGFCEQNGDMPNLQKREENGNPSQRQGLAQQQSGQPDGGMPELPYEGTQEESKMQDLWKDTERIGVLRETLPEIQKIRESFNVQKESIPANYSIRRLTPRETERLQGFPDDWTKYGYDGKEISDSQRYKMCGNAVSVPVVKAVMERLFRSSK